MTELAHRQTHAPDDDSYATIVGELEQVERDARERRLAAESEAERIRAAAAKSAAEIAAGVPAQVTAALADLRARHLAEAEAEVSAIEERLRADGVATGRESGANEGSETGDGPAHVADAAVDLLVSAVLAERSE